MILKEENGSHFSREKWRTHAFHERAKLTAKELQQLSWTSKIRKTKADSSYASGITNPYILNVTQQCRCSPMLIFRAWATCGSTSYDDGDFGVHVKIRGVTLGSTRSLGASNNLHHLWHRTSQNWLWFSGGWLNGQNSEDVLTLLRPAAEFARLVVLSCINRGCQFQTTKIAENDTRNIR